MNTRYDAAWLFGLLFFALVFLAVVESQTVSPMICEAEGSFEIDDGTCSKYYMCVYDGEKYNRYLISCAANWVFNPAEGKCVSSAEYACLQTTTTTAPCVTTTPTPCTAFGRFPVADTSCRKYYLCFWDGRVFSRIDLQCPSKLCFNATTQRCALPQN